MTLNHCGVCRTLLGSVALILLIGFVASGKTVRPLHGTSVSSASDDAVLDLSNFGAVGNGIADDGPALQRALDALGAAGGGTLFIPSGHYLIATPVTKDFGGLSGTVLIQGVPSLTMPAAPTANGAELSAGLDLTSDIIPATGESQNAINLANVHKLLIEHISFSGRPDEATDAATTLNLTNIDDATIRHCEFYGISTLLGGSVVKAERSAMSIEQSVFLGCTANSGLYAPVVENIEWRKVVISNSIFLDYGQRPFFSKTGFGAPLSWINAGNAALPTPDFPRR
ncbi:MAG TPA: glycosyl hydrolase family 28-related protein, partial [Pyrinomonadaceae bacterium]